MLPPQWHCVFEQVVFVAWLAFALLPTAAEYSWCGRSYTLLFIHCAYDLAVMTVGLLAMHFTPLAFAQLSSLLRA